MAGRKRQSPGSKPGDTRVADDASTSSRLGKARRARVEPVAGECYSLTSSFDHEGAGSDSKFLKKCMHVSGADIRKDASIARSRRARYLMVFPGRIQDVAGGRVGHLRGLDTAEPQMLLDAGKGVVIQLSGSHVKSTKRYAMLTLSAKGAAPKVSCDDIFDTMIVFHRAQFMRVERAAASAEAADGSTPDDVVLVPCAAPQNVIAAPRRSGGRAPRTRGGSASGSEEEEEFEDEEPETAESESDGEAGGRRRPAGTAALRRPRASRPAGSGAGGEDRTDDASLSPRPSARRPRRSVSRPDYSVGGGGGSEGGESEEGEPVDDDGDE